MDATQRRRIEQMRASGVSYANIAIALGLSKNTIKSFCRRNNLGIKGIVDTCDCCDGALLHTPGAKHKRFCSDKCRLAWWNAHPEAVNRKALYHITCSYCGAGFDSYGNRKRKYCSRACFGLARRAANE